MRNKSLYPMLAAGCLLAGAIPFSASAQLFSSTTGAQCTSQSNGLAYSLTQIRNVSPNNRSVYCPLQNTNGDSADYEFIYVYLKNLGESAVDITCIAKSGHGPFIFVPAEYATVSTTVTVNPGSTSLAVFDGVTGLDKVSTASHLALYCGLPPSTAIDMIWWSESDPAA